MTALLEREVDPAHVQRIKDSDIVLEEPHLKPGEQINFHYIAGAKRGGGTQADVHDAYRLRLPGRHPEEAEQVKTLVVPYESHQDLLGRIRRLKSLYIRGGSATQRSNEHHLARISAVEDLVHNDLMKTRPVHDSRELQVFLREKGIHGADNYEKVAIKWIPKPNHEHERYKSNKAVYERALEKYNAAVKALETEGRLLGLVGGHSHVAGAIDVVETPEGFGLVMKNVHGRNIDDVLKDDWWKANGERFMPLEVANAFEEQGYDALSTALLKGVFYQDIQPTNFMFDFADGTQVVDFGAAELIGPGMTTLDNVLGAALYYSPEVIRQLEWRNGKAAGDNVPKRPESITYSMGLIKYKLMTGKHPFWPFEQQGIANEEQWNQFKSNVLRGVFLDPRKINSACTQAEVNALNLALTTDPNRRPVPEKMKKIARGVHDARTDVSSVIVIRNFMGGLWENRIKQEYDFYKQQSSDTARDAAFGDD